jgi:hypothetical protein
LSPESVAGESPWFAGKDLPVWIYRVNRRPAGSLFDEPLPDVLDALSANLLAAPEGRTGTRYQREWRVGNVETNAAERGLTGRIGWSRSGEQTTNVWDENDRAWTDTVVPSKTSAAAPFWFDADRRYLGILRHPSFDPPIISSVLEKMLNLAEARRNDGFANVTWAVDAVGDTSEFRSWLDRTDAVTFVEFVFERPNPDAEEEFQDLFDRLNRLEAEKITERVVAQDKTAGISKSGLLHDPTVASFMAAAAAAFGYILARGRQGSRKVKFDQRRDLLTETAETVGVTWDAAEQSVRDAVKRATGRSKNG